MQEPWSMYDDPYSSSGRYQQSMLSGSGTLTRSGAVRHPHQKSENRTLSSGIHISASTRFGPFSSYPDTNITCSQSEYTVSKDPSIPIPPEHIMKDSSFSYPSENPRSSRKKTRRSLASFSDLSETIGSLASRFVGRLGKGERSDSNWRSHGPRFVL